MRVLELTAHVQTMRRARGQSATAAAAYRSCSRIACQKSGDVHDYRRKAGLEASGILTPEGAAWAADRGALWNAAELAERNGPRGPNAHAFRANAIVAREFMFGYPAELSAAGRLAVAQRVAGHLVARHGVAADFSIHRPGGEGDQRNFHCHMMVTSRQVDGDKLGRKTRELDSHGNGAREIKAFRATLAKLLNDALADEGQAGAVFVEHRSFKDRGSAQRPTRHQGRGATNAQRIEKKQAREAWHASQRSGQADRQAKERTGLADRQQAATVAMERAVSAREARAVEAVRTARIEAAQARIAELKALIQSERQSLAAAQAKERAGLADRHGAEERQLDRALTARIAADRAAEAQGRREEVRQLAQERRHGREQDGGSRRRT